MFFLVSCTPAKRLSRLVEKYPYLIQDTDTTIYYQTSSVDTTFVFNTTSKIDTFYIQETQTKIYRHFDTIRVDQKPIRDSIILKTHTVEIKESKKSDKDKRNLFNKIVVILTFIVVIMALYILRNIFK